MTRLTTRHGGPGLGAEGGPGFDADYQTYTYSSANGTLTQINRGLGTTLSVTAAAVQGLGASTAINASAGGGGVDRCAGQHDELHAGFAGPADAAADGRRRGAVVGARHAPATRPSTWTSWAGPPSYAYNSTQDLTQVAYPDGTFTTYQYELTFHQVTQIQDALGHLTTFTLQRHDQRPADAEGCPGQRDDLHLVERPEADDDGCVGRVTTMQWNSTTRQQTAGIDALGNITSFGYDGAGNQISVQDALGRVHDDSLRRQPPAADADQRAGRRGRPTATMPPATS